MNATSQPQDTQPTVTVHVDRDTADKLIALAGFTVLPYGSATEGTYDYFVRPGGRSRAAGGQFGTDYLWARDEALYEALAEIVANDVSR